MVCAGLSAAASGERSLQEGVRMDSRRFPPWFGVGFFAALCLLGSSFNCVCWGDDEHDWCEEHNCDDDVAVDDDPAMPDDDDTTPGKSKEELLGKHPEDDDTSDDDTAMPDDDDTAMPDDDDTAMPDDDTAMPDDDTSDDDTVAPDDDTAMPDDDTTGDDDTVSGPYTCDDFCTMEGSICIDWVGSGYTCLDFCASCMNQADLDCLETCPPDPLMDGCACVLTCLAAYLNP